MAINLENLAQMDYLGRAIILGKTKANDLFAVYILTGRSDSSKARILDFDDKTGVVFTKPTNPKTLEKGSPVLLLYDAIIPHKNGIAISNGAQTKLIYSAMNYANKQAHNILFSVLDNSFFERDKKLGWIDITSYEPDHPNYTPRIAGCIFDKSAAFSISYKEDLNVKKNYYAPTIEPGEGRLIATYDGIDTGDAPLNSFKEPPLDVALNSITPKEIAHKVRNALNNKYFIALACQFVGEKPYIINQGNN